MSKIFGVSGSGTSEAALTTNEFPFLCVLFVESLEEGFFLLEVVVAEPDSELLRLAGVS